jgi:hypothetical protein
MARVLMAAYAPGGESLPVRINPKELYVSPKTPLAQEAWSLLGDTSTAFRQGWLEMRANHSLGVFLMVGNPDQMDGSPRCRLTAFSFVFAAHDS